LAPSSASDIRAAKNAVVGFSAVMAEADKGIKGFLYPRMYRHPRVVRIMGEAEDVLRDLFNHFVSSPDALPVDWSEGLAKNDEQSRMRRIADYIAGMTDRYALIEHAKYFEVTPELR
jgi:dGTPase